MDTILNKLLKSSIHIADQLDRTGQYELANKLDQEIIELLSQRKNWQDNVRKVIAQQNSEEMEIEIPEEERLMLENVLISLQESLKDTSEIL